MIADQDDEATILRGWALTGAFLLTPGIVAVIALAIPFDSDMAFVTFGIWALILVPYLSLWPSVWGVMASVAQWGLLALLLGVVTRRTTFRRAAIWVFASVVALGIVDFVLIALFGHIWVFEGL